MIGFSIVEMRIGRIQPLGARDSPSAIDGQPVFGPRFAEDYLVLSGIPRLHTF
jgi:hypothetical protein